MINLKKEIEEKIEYINYLIKNEGKTHEIEEQRNILDKLLKEYLKN